MRSYANTLLLESALDSINTSNNLLWSVADTVMSPVVKITEEDCGTLLGESVLADYDAEGLTELATGVHLSRARINNLRTLGQARVDVRSLRACIARDGVCRACMGAARPVFPQEGPSFSNVKLLMHAEGPDGTQTYTDSSSYHRTVLGGAGTLVSNNRADEGVSSLHFNGSALTARYDGATVDEWARMGTDAHPMTLEMSIYFEGAASGPEVGGDGPGAGFWWGFAVSNAGTQLDLYEQDASPSASVPFLAPLVTGQFYRIAIQMTGTAHRSFHVWVNGSYQGGATSTLTPLIAPAVGATIDEASLDIGRLSSGAGFVGNIDELRITEQLFLPVGGNYPLAAAPLPDETVTAVPPVGSKIKVRPETFLQIVQASVPSGSTEIPLDFSPEQYDFLYLYKNGGLVPTTDYIISGKTLTLLAPPEVPPTLLMHFDGNFADATGNTIFNIGATVHPFNPSNTPTFTASDSPAFSQKAVVVGQSGAAGTSIVPMSIGTDPFTMEGRSKFTFGRTGGILISKSFWDSQLDAIGSTWPDWSLLVNSSTLQISWKGPGGPDQVRAVSFPAILDQSFAWAISDDGTSCRFYIDGVLVSTQVSAALAAFPPPISASKLSLFNAIQGFAGNTPDWGGTIYQGDVDELAITLGHAKYFGASYPVATAPFQVSSSSLTEYTIKYVVLSRVTFYYWLAATFSGAMLGIKPLPARPLILKKQLLLEAIPENDLGELISELEGVGTVTEDFTSYLHTIKDPLEKALFAILLGAIFLNT